MALPIRISQLDELGAVTDNDDIVVVDDDTSTTYRVAASVLKSYVLTNLDIGSVNNHTDVDTNTVAPNDLLKWNGTNWVPWRPVKQELVVISSTLADGASLGLEINDSPKTYSLSEITTSHAAWVVVYTDDTSRTNDDSRNETTDPLPGSGVIAEVITTGNTPQPITPGIIGWNTNGTIYVKVKNLSGGSAEITVILEVLPMEY